MEQKEKLEIIEQIKLLSDLESLSFANGKTLLDYLLEDINQVMDKLTKKLVGEENGS